MTQAIGLRLWMISLKNMMEYYQHDGSRQMLHKFYLLDFSQPLDFWIKNPTFVLMNTSSQ